MSYNNTPIEEQDFGFGVVGQLHYDSDPINPSDDYWDIEHITYLKSSPYTLGNDAVSRDEMDDIAEKIRSGEYVGLPVYAYVHSGITIRTGAFGDPWDSGQSGFAYLTKEDIEREGISDPAKYIEGFVETFDQYLRGDVYGYEILVDDEEVDSCWGLFGLDYAIKKMGEDARYHVEVARAEAIEAMYWADREVQTV